jgi:glutathione S-transferase
VPEEGRPSGEQWPWTFRVQTFGLDLSTPATDYVHRLLNLGAMREWYEAALAEPWREAAHEKEILAVGDLIEDLRAT